jgi:hypothetical protein
VKRWVGHLGHRPCATLMRKDILSDLHPLQDQQHTPACPTHGKLRGRGEQTRFEEMCEFDIRRRLFSQNPDIMRVCSEAVVVSYRAIWSASCACWVRVGHFVSYKTNCVGRVTGIFAVETRTQTFTYVMCEVLMPVKPENAPRTKWPLYQLVRDSKIVYAKVSEKTHAIVIAEDTQLVPVCIAPDFLVSGAFFLNDLIF